MAMMEPRGNLQHKHLSCATETSDKAAPKQLYHFSNQGADGRQPTEWESSGLGHLSYHVPIYGLSIVFAVFSFFSDNLAVKSVEEREAQVMPSTSVRQTQGCQEEQACQQTSHKTQLFALSVGGNFTKGYMSSPEPQDGRDLRAASLQRRKLSLWDVAKQGCGSWSFQLYRACLYRRNLLLSSGFGELRKVH